MTKNLKNKLKSKDDDWNVEESQIQIMIDCEILDYDLWDTWADTELKDCGL